LEKFWVSIDPVIVADLKFVVSFSTREPCYVGDLGLISSALLDSLRHVTGVVIGAIVVEY
jgi:hypothetical protein